MKTENLRGQILEEGLPLGFVLLLEHEVARAINDLTFFAIEARQYTSGSNC